MDHFFLFYILVLLWIVPFSFGSDNKLHVCMDGVFHKKEPGPEVELFDQCSAWKNRSCCTNETTTSLHGPFLHHNFDFNHCSKIKDMSSECRRFFTQDLCFYECSPNVGPWIVPVKMKIRNERYYRVPLCRRDCDAWFNACRDDYTCSSNWLHGWEWTTSGNVCSKTSTCFKFKNVFQNSTNFCEKVWDDSWKVSPDNEPCMTLFVNDSRGNPNDDVARFYARRNSNSASHFRSNILALSVVFSFLITVLTHIF